MSPLAVFLAFFAVIQIIMYLRKLSKRVKDLEMMIGEMAIANLDLAKGVQTMNQTITTQTKDLVAIRSKLKLKELTDDQHN